MTEDSMRRQHGVAPRGLDAVPQSPSYEGRFGRMFRALPTFQQPDELLDRLAGMMHENPGAPSPDNPNIPAGYTYLGQFIDHDITFDPNSDLQRMNDPEGLVNFRTPRFDLDSLYGSGPADEPFQYDEGSGAMKLLTGKGRHTDTGQPTADDDLPRNEQGTALIGDPRNDENIIVSQLHLAFLKLHNRFVDEVGVNQGLVGEELFKEAQRLTRWHYQWVVVHDFLARTVGQEVVDSILAPGGNGVPKIKLRHYRWKIQPYMPVEFSVAAYRFGHSQVRPTYKINDPVPELPIFSPDPNAGPLDDFRGFRFLPQGWTIDWSFFFDTGGPGTSRQASRAIDIRLAEGLFNLPGTPASEQSLALRNLKRGRALGLPSGQRVATAVGVPDLTREELGFWEPAPLWFYILKESELRHNGTKIGPVGGRIVAEVLLGLLDGDPLSWINVEPGWEPTIPDADGDGKITMVDLLRFAIPEQAGPPVSPPPGGWS